jgi:hypothetical protein
MNRPLFQNNKDSNQLERAVKKLQHTIEDKQIGSESGVV